MSCALYPSVPVVYTPATPSVRVCFTTGHITRECCCSPYSLQAHLQAVLGQCCSPTLTQQGHQRLAAWAAPPEHVDCNAPQCHLTWEWRGFCCAKRRHYIQDVLNRLATRLYSDGNAAWKQCLKNQRHIFCLKRCSTHFGGSINLDPFMQNYNATLSNSDTGLTIYIRSFDTPS